MKYILVSTLSLLALFAAGCSTPTHVDKGTIHARTFSFVVTGPKPADFVDKREAAHALIKDAITRNLAGKGVGKLEANGDITVAYLVVVGNPVSTTLINDYFGYSDDVVALADKAHAAYTGTKNPNYFEAGTLLIDLVDRSGKLLWRSYATRPVLGDVAAEVRAANIQGAVDEILAGAHIEP